MAGEPRLWHRIEMAQGGDAESLNHDRKNPRVRAALFLPVRPVQTAFYPLAFVDKSCLTIKVCLDRARTLHPRRALRAGGPSAGLADAPGGQGAPRISQAQGKLHIRPARPESGTGGGSDAPTGETLRLRCRDIVQRHLGD